MASPRRRRYGPFFMAQREVPGQEGYEVFRYAFAQISAAGSFHTGTFVANMLACFYIGDDCGRCRNVRLCGANGQRCRQQESRC